MLLLKLQNMSNNVSVNANKIYPTHHSQDEKMQIRHMFLVEQRPFMLYNPSSLCKSMFFLL
jgi:hypothetical protein